MMRRRRTTHRRRRWLGRWLVVAKLARQQEQLLLVQIGVTTLQCQLSRFVIVLFFVVVHRFKRLVVISIRKNLRRKKNNYDSESVPVEQFAKSFGSISLNNTLASCQRREIEKMLFEFYLIKKIFNCFYK